MTRFGRSGARRPIARNRTLRGAVACLGVAWFVFPVHVAAQARSVEAPPDSQTPGASRVWPDIALGAGVLGGAFLLDDNIRTLALDQQGTLGRDLADAGHAYGDWKRTAPFLAGGGILLGVALDGEQGVRRATSAFFGVFAGSMSNTILNWTLGRSRPRDERGVLHFDPFRSNASLGSGHTAYAFAIAAAVDEVTDGGWAIPFYAAAAGTGLARIYGDRHWLSDVVVGGFIGWWVGGRATEAAAGWLRVEPSSVSSRRSSPARARIRPLIAGDALGIQMRFRE
ncbi:phosphatase PAP2 family protein [Candidatus Palauibacter sp.]|uniref:phosphatase PAP2 family protein n=1 Tax=Candidatus Palauibacter sp. TaxID=3101350 RepID=UPI003B0154D8